MSPPSTDLQESGKHSTQVHWRCERGVRTSTTLGILSFELNECHSVNRYSRTPKHEGIVQAAGISKDDLLYVSPRCACFLLELYCEVAPQAHKGLFCVSPALRINTIMLNPYLYAPV